MANVASPVNTNSRDLDPVVTRAGYVGLKRGRGRVTATSTTPDTVVPEYTLAAASTATLANVAGSASSVTLLAANAERLGATIVNDSTAILYVKFGSAATTTSYTVMLAGTASSIAAYYEVPFGYTGIITGIWASATGSARVTELAV